MIGVNNKAEVWGTMTYRTPVPYLRQRLTAKKEAEEGKSSRFVQAPGDGAAYKFGKGNRGRFYHINSYGKDGKEPPHSYLPYKEMGGKKVVAVKKEGEGEKKGATGRGSFIDAIFFNGKKYKYPGPGNYFSATEKGKEKANKKEAETKDKDKKKFERLNFLCDAEYLGMNYPCPGTYNLKASAASR